MFHTPLTGSAVRSDLATLTWKQQAAPFDSVLQKPPRQKHRTPKPRTVVFLERLATMRSRYYFATIQNILRTVDLMETDFRF